MTKFEKKANELGLDMNNLSKALIKEVNDYYEGIDDLKSLKESLNDASDEEAEAIQNEIDELQDVLNDLDVLLVQKIEKYNQNKASYDDKIKKMAEGREKAKQAKLQGQAQPQPTPQPQAQAQPQPQVQPKVETQGKTNTEEEAPKEKDDWGWLVFAGIVGAITLGAVILRKK
jgi:hypothetical protein